MPQILDHAVHATLAALAITALACGTTSSPDPVDAPSDRAEEVAPEANSGGSSENSAPQSGCSSAGIAIVNGINEVRRQNALPDIPLSPSLCTVASAHTRDMASQDAIGGECNLHSWSSAGPWSACCYTSDHAQAQCMWDKPGELTAYKGYGYENSAAGVSSAEQAIELWLNSPGHRGVILNEGIWKGRGWQAIGADLHQGYAVVWFGNEPEP